MNPHLCLVGDATSAHVQRWANEMLTRRYRVSLITARPQALDGIEQRIISPIRRSTDWLFRVNELEGHVRELAPDIVHAHYVTSYGYLAARCRRRPLVMTAWGSDILVSPSENRLIKWLTGWTLRRADLITGDSTDLVDAIARYSPHAPIEQVHWGADMTKFRPAPWAAKAGFQVVSLRAWEPNYRIDAVIQGVALFLQRHPDAPLHLHLLGGGSLEPNLRALAIALGVLNRVSFHGRLGDAEMAAVLDRCKVSVSLPRSDATSVSVLESMASGLPVIASDLPANRQWLDSADMLIKETSAAAVATALETLWRDDAMAQDIGVANLERMQSDGARAIQMDRMVTLYAQLLGDKS